MTQTSYSESNMDGLACRIYDMRWAALLLRTYGPRQAALSVVRRHGGGAVMKAREAAAG